MFVLRPLTRSVALFAPKQANRACVICDAVTARWATSGPARPQRQQQSQPTQRDAPRKPAQAPASSGQHSKGQQRPQQQQSQSQQRDSGNRPPQTRTQSSGQPRTQNQQQNSSDTDGRKQKWLPQSAILEDIKTGSKNEELHPKLVAQVIGLRGEALGSLSIEKLKEMLPKLAAEREIPADDPYEKGTLPDMILVDRTQKPPVVKLKMPDTQEMIAARETAAAKAKEAQKHRATVVKEIELTTVIGTNDLKVSLCLCRRRGGISSPFLLISFATFRSNRSKSNASDNSFPKTIRCNFPSKESQ